MQERLQKIIARAGITSRRKAERLIVEGRVSVNGRTVTELGAQADPRRDEIRVDGRRIELEPSVYLVLYKPQGVLSTVNDPQGRPTVMDFVPRTVRLYPVGRLDAQSEGLLLLTNDGELAAGILQAGGLEKVYRVKVRGKPDPAKLQRLMDGIRREGERLRAASVMVLRAAANTWLEVVLLEGRNRQLRRMFEAIGHPVMRLRRVAIGPVQLGDLKPGRWRHLSAEELAELREALREPLTPHRRTR
ncbi:MAG: pseudouridine synthase [Acidobacteriota bacterium]